MVHPRLLAALTAALLLAGQPPAAQTTPEALWALAQSRAETEGRLLSADQLRRDGPDLLLEGLSLLAETDGASVEAPGARVTLRDRGDGTVALLLPEASQIALAMPGPRGTPLDLALTLGQQGFDGVVSGPPDAPVLRYRADSLTADVVSARLGGVDLPMQGSLRISGAEGQGPGAGDGGPRLGAARIEATASGLTTQGEPFGLTATGSLQQAGGAVARPVPGLGLALPVGTVDVVLTGVEAMLQALAGAGALSADDLTGIRLGLALMAQPGAADGSLTFRIEATADGRIALNGQPIR
jgi:hypothetical protein